MKIIFNTLKKDRTLFILVLVFVVYTVLFISLRFFKFDYSYNFGYLDHQLYWEALYRLLDGQTIYKEFYWEYGPLYLIYSLPLFVLLNKTFSGYVFIRLVFLPITGLVLAYFLGRELLKGKYLVLFLLVSAMYSTMNFETIRHIVAELGLVLSILGIHKEDKKKATVGSIFLGISLTAGIEYAAISILVFLCYTVWVIYRKGRKTNFKMMSIPFIGLLVAGVFFFGFLAAKGALGNYFKFFGQFSNSFFYVSPCRNGFPKLDSTTFSSINSFRRMNLFFIPFLNVLLAVYIFMKRKGSSYTGVLLPLLLFSWLAFGRTMINPCLNTLAYCSTLLILVFMFVLRMKKPKTIQLFMYALLVWMVLFSSTNGPIDLSLLLKRKITAQTEYIEVADIRFDKDKAEKMRPVIDFINNNVEKGDYVYVYPYGPYNQLTGTKSPVSLIISTHFELAPFLVPKVIDDLEEKKPEYIVINRINAWSYLSAMHVIPQSMVEYGDVPVFAADLTDVEKYISKNYAIFEKFEQAWILKKRDLPIEYTPPYIQKEIDIQKISLIDFESQAGPYNSQTLYITGSNPEVVYLVGPLKDTDMIKFPVKGNPGIFRYSSQHLIRAFLFSLDENLLDNRADILSNDWQKLMMEIRNDESVSERAMIIVSLSSNRGFFSLGGFPESIEIKIPEFYQLNPEIFD